jgi:peroxiredoxin
VAIGYRQTEEDVAKFSAAQQLPYTVLWDKDNKVSEEWSVRSIPTNFVIDLDGVIRYRSFGISPEVETLLQSMIKSEN